MAAKFLLSLGLAALAAGHSFGNPTGGSIAAGSATITTVPGTVTINQASSTAIIDWQTFSIASGETTKFVQPSAASAALNRVLGGETSTIDGNLEANGQIILINGNGIVVGPSGMVNTNGFIASTRDIADSDFLSGNLHFTGSNNSGVANSGTITSPTGDVYLIGKTVDNEGTISTPGGTTGLAAGDDVLLNLSGQQHVFVSPATTATSATGQTAITNGGTISGAQAELAAANGNLYALAINNSGTIRANSVTQTGGRVFLTTDAGLVQNTGTICAKLRGNGGDIYFTGGSVWNRKTINASGATGGRVQIQGVNVQNDGSISTQGMTGYGGNVYITFTGNALGSVTGTVDSSGWIGGGSIDFLGYGATSEAYLSLNLQCAGVTQTGGRIVVDSPSVYLAGATLNAGGPAGQGDIFLGVPDAVYNRFTDIVAQNLYIGLGTTLNASATEYGNGGTIIAVGLTTSANFGTVMAKAHGGPGYTNGTIDIPPTPASPPVVATTVGTGAATGGGAGASPAPAFEFVDPDPHAGNSFGQPGTGVFNLSSNTTLITSPGDSFSAAGAGAAYLFNDTTGALLSTIRGTGAGDAVGSAVEVLTSNSFVVETPSWSDGMGAMTFGNGLHGFDNGGGDISASNSLVGSTAGDEVGSGGLTRLFNGNYLVLSPGWSGGAGAVTLVNPASGLTGAVSAGNSLVGAAAGDNIGSGGIVALDNGANYLVLSPNWGGGAGAITNGRDSTGAVGVVSAGNSLVGASVTDAVGAAGSIVDTEYGYYLVLTPNWGGGAGAVTWNSSSGGTTGAVSAANSLVGSSGSDAVGDGGITILNDDRNYVVSSPDWNNDTGAVTLGIGSEGVTGVVGSNNSLVGAGGGDEAGGGGIEAIAGGGAYLILTPNFNNAAGAVTLASDARGVTGTITASNSVIGASAGDNIGSGGISLLGNSNLVVLSPDFENGAGAATFMSVPDNGGSPVAGVVSAANSLVGSLAGDNVGSGGVIQLSNGGNFLILSPNWDGGKGAITNGDDFEGLHGTVSATNSLVGANGGDHVGAAGSVTDPFNGSYYFVTTPNFGGGAGAVTWNNIVGGATGAISALNSLIGSSSGDHVGSGGIQNINNGDAGPDYLVLSPDFDNGAGAVTFASGLTGIDGAVSSANSLVGAQAGDHIGSGGIVPLGFSYLVLSPEFHGGAGAITPSNNGILGAGITGIVSASNSLVGAAAGDAVGSPGSIVTSDDDNFLALTPNFGGGAGAVTFSSADPRFVTTGVISDSNSLVGSSSTDHIGSGGVTVLNGAYAIDSPDWSNGTGAVTIFSLNISGVVSAANSVVGDARGDDLGSGGLVPISYDGLLILSPQFDNGAGAVTGINYSGGGIAHGAISSANSLVGASPGDAIGSGGLITGAGSFGSYFVLSPNFDGGAGAITEGNEGQTFSPVTGVVSAANSLVGASAGDGVGASVGSIVPEPNYYLVLTPSFDNGAGAITFSSYSTPATGVISASNSLVGSSPGDAIGSGGITFLSNVFPNDGNIGYLVNSPDWNNGAGAVTFGSAAGGVSGAVGATNSLVGASGGDAIGSGGLLMLANGNYLVLSPDFAGNAGAVTFIGGAGRAGVVGAANSLVGATSGDNIGSGGIATLANGNYLVLSPDFAGGTGAVTFGSAARGVSGVVSAANSLVGASAGDYVGGGGIIFLSNGDYLVQSPDFAGSAGAVTWGSAVSGVTGTVTATNSIVGGMPDAGEEFAGESANGNIYLISFTTDTSEGGDGRVIAGSTAGPAPTPTSVATDFLLLPQVNTVESSGFNFDTGIPLDPVVDPNAPAQGTSSTDPFSESAINSGHGGHDIASGSSTSFSNSQQRLVTPGNGVWGIFDGVVHSAPPPQWISSQLQLNLSPEVYAHLNQILFGSH